MKYYILFIVLTTSFLSSCKKEDVDISGYAATVNLVNAIASYNTDIKMNFTGKPFIFANSKSLNYSYNDGKYSYGALTFGVPVGKVPLSIALANDTTKLIFNQDVTFAPGDVYSLFMHGYPDNVSGLLVKDEIPIRTDSTTGVRFVNLSPNSNGFRINISGEPIGSAVDNLPYKGVSDFISFPAKASNQEYFIEVYDAVTDELLTGFYYYDIARLKNITLVIRGVMYDSPDLELVRINHY
ncbi:DUF4397 domain-containing protein [Chitinophaga ginsengisoli]|uniref:Uncharacterized protein DUF4397 n=1 Tax=Chitinophaga ginsengisoli TaxID=363837 RepID=A0A2P8G9N8_9BACT|nr:DUF4397 domain-containing protein [Chitinophaga ginsengisoli]PSL30690.1 uncharacterized protein DUF4397 [Chitinophaga ginsengisoli]